MKILIKKEIAGYKPNTIIDINENDYTDMSYWHRRLSDAQIDNCCEIVKGKIEEKNKEKENMIQSVKKKEKYSVK